MRVHDSSVPGTLSLLASAALLLADPSDAGAFVSANRAVGPGSPRTQRASSGVVERVELTTLSAVATFPEAPTTIPKTDSDSPSKLSTFEKLLTLGGDERNALSSEGKNQYHIAPRPIGRDDAFRGSCTCNAPTVSGYDAAKRLFDESFEPCLNNDGEVLPGKERELIESVSQTNDRHRKELSSLLDLPEGSEIVLCPSGSDAEYVPLLIAEALALSECAGIANVCSQARETGRGSFPAATGRLFSNLTPLGGKANDGAGAGAGAALPGLTHRVEGVNIPARLRCGSVSDVARDVSRATSEARRKGRYVIEHAVIRGKTGLVDPHSPVSLDGGRTSLAVYDACQGRFALSDLRKWLSDDVCGLVLFTGSKMMQGPPFSGAVIVPPRIANALRERPPPSAVSMEGLGDFVTRHELPECMKSWRTSLPDAGNVGLALRWEAALAGGMRPLFKSTSCETRSEAVEAWSTEVRSMVNEEGRDMLDAWHVDGGIVSIRIRHNDDSWMDVEQLKRVFQWCSEDLSDLKCFLKRDVEVARKKCFLGQPVDVAESHAILRIAIEAESLLDFCGGDEGKGRVFEDDRSCVRKLALIARHFDEIERARR